MSISPPVFPSHPSSLSPSTSSFLSAISSPENGSPVFPEAFRDREVASISPPTLFGRLGTTTREQTPSSSYSTTYSVNSVNSIKSRKNVLYQRCERHEPILLNSMPISNVMDMGGTLNYIASEGPTSLADLERWRLSTRPGPIIEHPSHSDSCGRGRAERVFSAINAVSRIRISTYGDDPQSVVVERSLKRAGRIVQQIWQWEENQECPSGRPFVDRYADTLSAVCDVAMANKKVGAQVLDEPCTALVATLERAISFLADPNAKPPLPKRINRKDAKQFQDHIASASQSVDICGVLDKTVVALRTIDMMRSARSVESDLVSVQPTDIEEEEEAGENEESISTQDSSVGGRGRSRTITQATVSMSMHPFHPSRTSSLFPSSSSPPSQSQSQNQSQAQIQNHRARQALQRLRAAQTSELENDLARVRFFIWRIIDPLAKVELQCIVDEVLPSIS